MIETLFTRKTFTTRNNVQICADPEVFVYEGRVEQYVQVMDGGPVFAAHVKKAVIRSVVKGDAFKYSRHPNLPVLEVTSDHEDEKVLLAISGHVDDYDESPHWELQVRTRSGLMYHASGVKEDVVDLFRKVVHRGGSDAVKDSTLHNVFNYRLIHE